LLVCSGIESPDTIKDGAPPEQRNCGKTRHGSSKEEENAYRRESRYLSLDGEVEARATGSHLLNISQLTRSRLNYQTCLVTPPEEDITDPQ